MKVGVVWYYSTLIKIKGSSIHMSLWITLPIAN